MRALFGRETSRRSVERFLDSMVEGSAALVLQGEAGMGKTELWRDALTAAAGRGHQVPPCSQSWSRSTTCNGSVPGLPGVMSEGPERPLGRRRSWQRTHMPLSGALSCRCAC